MKLFVIIFMIFATIFTLATLVYVAVDLIVEIIRKKRKEEEPEPAPVPPVVVAAPPPPPVFVPVVLPEIVEHIDAEEADEMLSDEDAMAFAKTEEGAGTGFKSYINLGVIDKHFNAGDTVTLAVLKEKNLLPKKVQRIKILADGILTKAITVKAESYSIQAIKMIELTGGTVIILE